MKRLARILLRLTLLLSLLLAPLEQYIVGVTMAAAAGAGASPDGAAPLSYNPNSLQGIADGNPAAGVTLIEPPQVNNRGEAWLSYPIEVPQGRNGLQPELSVAYNSAGANGWMGLGWDLGTSAIAADTRWGVPRYHATLETETYVLDGMQLTPLAGRGDFQPRVRNQTFQSRVEGEFKKIIRHGDSPTNYRWEVVDKGGVRFFYGGDHRSNAPLANATLTDGGGRIFKWALTEVRDLHGNGVKYEYERVTDTGISGGSVAGYQLYLKSINYTQSNDALGPYTVTFFRDDQLQNVSNFTGKTSYARRADVIIDARGGFKMVTAALLKRIDVRFKNDLISRYDFLYEERAFKKTVLRSVTQSGADAGQPSAAQFTHNFSYYDDIRDGTRYKGFEPGATWSTQDDNISASAVLLDGQASALSGAVSTGGGGHVYIGFNLNSPTKQMSGGGKLGFNVNSTEVVLAMIDLNGDNLPDKVYRRDWNPLDPGSSKVYFRLNKSGPSSAAATTFGPEVELTTLKAPGIGRDFDFTISGGAEVYVGLSALYNHAETFTTGSTYFSDVNGDGLPDLVSGGAVLFNRLVNGVPSFDPNSANTLVPIGPGSVDATGIISDYTAIYQKALAQAPLLDSVRRWQAPFSGQVRIEGTVALVKDTTPARALYQTADGVRVAIQKEDTELWSARIGQDDYSPKTPTGVNTIDVQAGDAIYFRVGSVFDGSYDQVAWNPHITYLNVQTAVDVNGLNHYVYQASDDFVPFGHSDIFVQVPLTGTLRLTGALRKLGPTSDDASLLVLKNGTQVFSQTLAWNQSGDFALPPDLEVRRNDKIQLRVKVDSPIDARQLQWNPNLFYVATNPPQAVTDSAGNYVFQLNPPYNLDIYPVDGLTSPQQTWTAPQNGTLTVIPEVTVRPWQFVTGTLPLTGAVAVTVKRKGELLAKHIMNVSNGEVRSSSFTVEVSKGDPLYFDFSVQDPRFAAELTAWSVRARFGEQADTNVPNTLHRAAQPGLFGGQYRGWSYLGYNGNDDWANKPISKSRLTLNASVPLASGADASKPLTKEMLAYKPDGTIDYTNYNPTDSTTAYLFTPSSRHNRWRGPVELAWISGSQISSSRHGSPNISVPRSEDFAGARAVEKMSRTSQDLIGGGFILSGSLSGGSSYSEVDYLDMNGDGFPDIVGNGRIQYTTPNGGLEANNVARSDVAFVDHALDSESLAGNIGIGGNPATFKANSRGEVGTSNKGAPRGNKSGSQMASLGFSGSLGVGTSAVPSRLLDMNGDGLPDKVSVREGALRVRLNLGYGFAREERWESPTSNSVPCKYSLPGDFFPAKNSFIDSGCSETASLGVSLGFNGGIY
ncbi:MAG: sugar-binding protein, partial [Chloroflexota bacterium]|nr:sugar-binding protein [Chloroflexota bacterium]